MVLNRWLVTRFALKMLCANEVDGFAYMTFFCSHLLELTNNQIYVIIGFAKFVRILED